MESSLDNKSLKEFYLDYGFATRSVHAGEHVAQPSKPISHTNPIYQSSTFVFESAQQGKEIFEASREGYIYTRLGNPTTTVLEAKLNALEGRDIKMLDPDNTRISCLTFASGMAAASAVTLGVLGQGDNIIRGEVVYGCTDDLFLTVFPRFGITDIRCDTSNLAEFRSKMEANPKTKMVYFESPTNPTLKITDIAELCKIAKSINPEVLVVVDNTFCTPYLQQPLTLGADAVLHSTTKYIGGHGAIIGGAVITKSEFLKDQLFHMIKDLGGNPSPHDAWLTNMGLKTLPIRMERICSSAMKIATFLNEHPALINVAYPGLPNFPQHELAKKQMKDFGGIITFEVKAGYEAAQKLMDNVHLFGLAVSLGGVDSLIQHPASMTHATVPEAKRLETGITNGMVRISIGLEDPEDLIYDLDKALKCIDN